MTKVLKDISTNGTKYFTEINDVGGGIDILQVYPIGSIYMSVLNTNPSTLFGGTWSVWGAGRVAVGVDTGQTEFNTVEKTGGAKTHTLTVDEMPSHTHIQNSHNHTQNSHNHTQNSHNHTQNPHSHITSSNVWFNNSDNFTVRLGSSSTGYFSNASNSLVQNTTATNNETTATNNATTATNIATTATNQNTGGGGAHNNLQPYITCYMWKRTA